jgi:2-keto-4-pentenoate hydratase/2-oxohepta-3-ene-1,7-dioic acid hydratase in catechol pathway
VLSPADQSGASALGITSCPWFYSFVFALYGFLKAHFRWIKQEDRYQASVEPTRLTYSGSEDINGGQMKLAQFATTSAEGQSLGVLIGDRIVEVAALAGPQRHSSSETTDWLSYATYMDEIIRRDYEGLARLAALVERYQTGDLEFEVYDRFVHQVDSVRFLPPVDPTKIVAIGRNYVDHAIEGGSEPPAAPLIFNKLPNSLSAHNAPIVLHKISTQIDYEAELAVVIGRRATRVSESEALEYIFGYTLINDVSARDLQFGDGQWVRGKSLDGFAPLGPFITTRDEIPDVQALNIEGRLNGEVMQSSNTSKMIFNVAYLVSYISQGITLAPGDVIATGTPDGVGIFRKPPVLLKAGDVFEVTIEGLGTLRNPVVAAD